MQLTFGHTSTNFQWFQAQLGISVGGLGIKPAIVTHRAAYLASSVEYLRYSMEHLECEEDEFQWIDDVLSQNIATTYFVNSTMQEMKRLFEVFGDVFHNAGNYNWISRVDRASKENTLETELRSWLHRLLFKHSKPLQHIFYDTIMAPASNNMVDAFFGDSFISDGEKARFRSTSAQHAGKWLAAIPKEGLIMHSHEFKTAMLIRLGMKVVTEDLKCTYSSVTVLSLYYHCTDTV